MPERLQILANFIEVLCLTLLNTFFLITWMSFFSAIPIIVSTIYGLGRIKRDIEKYHNGKPKEYFMYLIGKAKKN